MLDAPVLMTPACRRNSYLIGEGRESVRADPEPYDPPGRDTGSGCLDERGSVDTTLPITWCHARACDDAADSSFTRRSCATMRTGLSDGTPDNRSSFGADLSSTRRLSPTPPPWTTPKVREHEASGIASRLPPVCGNRVLPARAVAAALAAGCTIVLRPSSLTPLASLALARCLTGAGLPPGVLNVVVSSADDATDAVLADGRIRKLTFTGSVAVGRQLIARSAEQVVRTSMELGGCAPFIVFDDADLTEAVAGAVAAKMRNGGAACTAANRFFIQRPIYEEFTRRLATEIARMRIGPGTRAGVTCGPMISARHVARLAGLVDDAVDRGARVLVSGGPVPGDGHFFAPVVLCDVPAAARAMREEIFGPVVALAPFETEAEVLARANDHPSGLAAYVYTADLGRGIRLGDRINAGMVAVNCSRVSCVAAPFGGVGHAGFGMSGGLEGIDEYLVTRYVTMPAS